MPTLLHWALDVDESGLSGCLGTAVGNLYDSFGFCCGFLVSLPFEPIALDGHPVDSFTRFLQGFLLASWD